MKIVFFEYFLSLEFLQSLKQDGSSSIHFSGFLESEKYLVPNVWNTVQIRHFPNATVLYGCDFGLKTQKLAACRLPLHHRTNQSTESVKRFSYIATTVVQVKSVRRTKRKHLVKLD